MHHQQHSSLLSLLLLLPFLHRSSIALAQAPAPSPSPTGPTNVVKILKKAGEFKTFVRLLKTTQLDSNLNSQLGDTNNGLTIFAPSDAAFTKLKTPGRSLNRREKMQLVQFHIVPTFISRKQFETVSNPLKTHAGSGDRFLLNVTVSGDSVNVKTGVINTTVSGTVYTDTHLAIYRVDDVLLPAAIFGPKEKSPAAAAPAAAKKVKADDESDDEGDDGDGDGVSKNVSRGVIVGFGSLSLGICIVLAHIALFL
ncbi:unnamed protein product [Linum trigynum]|uniref:FAS1 domain-containing protein n=1 Tax=Linum trigynum TaxID=586398 RepID=A0AAV2FYD8_9ROSI